MPRRNAPVSMRPAGYGLCLSELDRYNEAEAALVETYEILMGSVGPDNEDTIGLVESFADLYSA